MIEHGAIERFGGGGGPAGGAGIRGGRGGGGGGERAGGAAIGVARAGVAARMVVREQYSGAAVLGGIDDNGLQREGCTRFLSWIPRNKDATRLVIDMGDPQILAHGVGVGHAAGKEFPGRRQTIELQREFGTLIPHRRQPKRSGEARLCEPCPEWIFNVD